MHLPVGRSKNGLPFQLLCFKIDDTNLNLLWMCDYSLVFCNKIKLYHETYPLIKNIFWIHQQFCNKGVSYKFSYPDLSFLY